MEPEVTTEAEASSGVKRVRRQFWDDEAFRLRVAALAAERGLSVREAMVQAGVAVDYASKTFKSRGINQMLEIAAFFEVPAAVVLGLPADQPPPPLDAPGIPSGRIWPKQPHQVITAEALKTVLLHAERWLFLALSLNRPDVDLKGVAAALSLDLSQIKLRSGKN